MKYPNNHSVFDFRYWFSKTTIYTRYYQMGRRVFRERTARPFRRTWCRERECAYNMYVLVSPCGTRRWNSGCGCVTYRDIPRPRYLLTVDDPPSRVSPRSPRDSSLPFRWAPFARCYRHFRSQYHLLLTNRSREADHRLYVSKNMYQSLLHNIRNTIFYTHDNREQ